MSLGHMPRWYQRMFGVMWVLSVGVVVLTFVMHPFEHPLSPFPFIVTLVLSVTLIRAAWVRLFGSDEPEEAERQAELSEFNQNESVSETR